MENTTEKSATKGCKLIFEILVGIATIVSCCVGIIMLYLVFAPPHPPTNTDSQSFIEPTPNNQTTLPTESPTDKQPFGSAPVIDSIGLPASIVCDKRKYDVPIKFHDEDGDAHRIQWELLYSKKQTTLYTDAKEFGIDSQLQKQGAVYNDFIAWYTPGDQVKIRVYITDRTNLSGFMDFEFVCSN